MKKSVQIIKSHPGSVICYILYALFCFIIITSSIEFNATFDHIKPGDRAQWGGQGELFGVIGTFIIAVIFIVIMTFNGLLRKMGQSFYWWMCLFIVVPLFVLMGVIYLSN